MTFSGIIFEELQVIIVHQLIFAEYETDRQ